MSTVKANTIEPASGGTVTITGAALTTPALGTAASGTLTNCTGLPASTGLSGTTLASSVVNASLNAITPSGGTLALTGSQTISGNLGLGATPQSVGGAAMWVTAGSDAGSTYSGGFISAVGSTAKGYVYYDNVGSVNTFLMQAVAGVSLGFRANAAGVNQMTLDTSGNLLVGATSGNHHTLKKDVSQGTDIAVITSDAGGRSARFLAVAAEGWNTADAAIWVGKNSVTNRGINSGGTINASGADAAEYERNGGLKIAKGQIVGFGPDGVLTDKFDSAIRFGVKSTNPHLVGGDTWGTEDKIGQRPEKPQFKAPEYTGRAKPEDLPEDATEEQASQHARDMADWNVDQVEHKARTDIERNLFDTATYPEYLRDKAAFEERLEAARQQVDRVAYCGKVPCNVQGATPGDYIVAVNDGSGGIKGLPVRNPTFEQYRAAVGRVNRILPDGRAEIAVIVH